MAFKLNDRVKETSTFTGSPGTINLAGAVDGFETFATGIGGNNETYFCISHITLTEFEVGRCTLNASGNAIISRTIFTSSNSNSLVNFSAGTKEIFCTLPAQEALSPGMSPTKYVVTHNSIIQDTQTMDSGVLAGPVTITGSLTITGNLFIL
tara:strand:- start:230 stop:685 length:456 start_codon:yes stop_codon:yes gene_type:complete